MSWENDVKRGIRNVMADSHASIFLRHSIANPDDTEVAVEVIYRSLVLPLVKRGILIPVEIDPTVEEGKMYMIQEGAMYHGPVLNEFPFLYDPPSGSIEQGFHP